MLVARITASLAKKVKIKISETDVKSSTLFGDWFFQDVHLDKQQYILCVAEKTRLPLLIKAAPYARFHERFREGLQDLLQDIGVPKRKIDLETTEAAEVVFAKTNNRSILGSMNDYVRHLEFVIHNEKFKILNIRDESVIMADTISLQLPEHTPKEATLLLFTS